MDDRPTTPAEHILVVEDEQDLREGLRHNLELDGYRVSVAADGDQALARLREGGVSLVLLDLMMAGTPGLEVLRTMRAAGDRTPVVVVSARGQDRDKVAGLELGADDYVTKPFGLSELAARIRAVLRRTGDRRTPGDAGGRRDVHRFGDLAVDFRRYTVRRGDVEHQLSRYEAEILALLIHRRGEVVTRADLLKEVWGYVHLPTTRTVDNHIARLRKKLEVRPEEPEHVITVHGIGYRFEPGGGR